MLNIQVWYLEFPPLEVLLVLPGVHDKFCDLGNI